MRDVFDEAETHKLVGETPELATAMKLVAEKIEHMTTILGNALFVGACAFALGASPRWCAGSVAIAVVVAKL